MQSVRRDMLYGTPALSNITLTQFVSLETPNIVFGVYSKLKIFEICDLATLQVRARYCC